VVAFSFLLIFIGTVINFNRFGTLSLVGGVDQIYTLKKVMKMILVVLNFLVMGESYCQGVLMVH